jgi:hypothetical protein
VLSECARMTTPEEARYRVGYPNSTPRRIKIVALDESAERAVRNLAGGSWNSASFMTTANGEKSRAIGDWLSDLSGKSLNLLDQVNAADLVVTVSTAGESAADAAVIADACAVHGIKLTALVIDPASVPEPLLLRTMVSLRAHAAMLVLARNEDYVEAMLTALRA